MKNKKILVTGATGLLGSHLVKNLLDEGNKVIVLVRDKVPYSYFYELRLNKKTVIVDGDLLDRNLIERVMFEYEIDGVFHLGAQTQVVTANSYPLSTWRSNVEGTWNMLEAARNYGGCKTIIVASSDKAYGEHKQLPYLEDTPLLGISPYDASKACADMISRSYAITYGLPVVITRCANIFGEGDYNLQRLIPGAIDAFSKNRVFIIRSDGKLVRDYIYVKDVVEAMLLIWKVFEKEGLGGEVFNISSEKPMSVLAIVKEISKVMKKRLKYKIARIARNEIKKQTLSASKLKSRLGWKVAYSLNKGLKKTIDWQMKGRGYR